MGNTLYKFFIPINAYLRMKQTCLYVFFFAFIGSCAAQQPIANVSQLISAQGTLLATPFLHNIVPKITLPNLPIGSF